jgi:tetratricopeptide (TPR) repeat protein
MNKRWLPILLLTISLSFPVLSFAETILLKSGKTVEGKLIERTDQYIKIDFQGVPLTYFFDEIENIDGQKIGPLFSKVETNDKKLADRKDSTDIQTEGTVKEKYNLAINYFQNKDYVNAHNFFGEILAYEPDPYKAIVYFNMGMCLQVAGVEGKGDAELTRALFAQAAKYYQKAQDIMPDFPQLYSNAALIARYLNHPNSVVEEFYSKGQQLTDKFGAFPPDVDNKLYSYKSYEALLTIATNYIVGGNYSDAVGILKDVVDRMEQVPPQKTYLQYTAYNLLGLCLYNLGDNKGAINYIESSIKLAPSQPKLDFSYANLAMLYFKQGDYTKAHEATRNALVLNPNNQIALDYQNKLESKP